MSAARKQVRNPEQGPGAPGARVELNILSDPANLAPARQEIEDLCTKHGFDAKAVGEIGLCVNEALANIIRHAYGNAEDKPIELAAGIEDAAVIITIRDWGNGVDPSRLAPKVKDPLVPGGLGLMCLVRMMDGVTYQPQPDGMLLTMTRRRTKA